MKLHNKRAYHMLHKRIPTWKSLFDKITGLHSTHKHTQIAGGGIEAGTASEL